MVLHEKIMYNSATILKKTGSVAHNLRTMEALRNSNQADHINSGAER